MLFFDDDPEGEAVVAEDDDFLFSLSCMLGRVVEDRLVIAGTPLTIGLPPPGVPAAACVTLLLALLPAALFVVVPVVEVEPDEEADFDEGEEAGNILTVDHNP